MTSSRYPIGKTKKILIEFPLTQGTSKQRVRVHGFTKPAIGYRLVGWRCEPGVYRPFVQPTNNRQRINFYIHDVGDLSVSPAMITYIYIEDRKYSIPQLLRILTARLNQRWVNDFSDTTGVDVFEAKFARALGNSQILLRNSTTNDIFQFRLNQDPSNEEGIGYRNPQYILAGMDFHRYGATGFEELTTGLYPFTLSRQRFPESFSVYCPQLQERTAGNPLVSVVATGRPFNEGEQNYVTPLVTVIRKETGTNSRTMINESFTDLTNFFPGNTFEFEIRGNVSFPYRTPFHTFDPDTNAVINSGNRAGFEYPDIYLRFEFLIKQ